VQLRSTCVPVVGGSDYVFGATHQRAFPIDGAEGFAHASIKLAWAQGAIACDSLVSEVALRAISSDWARTALRVVAPATATTAYFTLSVAYSERLTADRARTGRQYAVARFDDILLAPVALSGTTTTTTVACGGTCGDPVSHSLEAGDTAGGLVTASDALFILIAAVQPLQPCAPCICDVDASGEITAVDALLTLLAATGDDSSLTCPP
jgi:hypothetical protein